MVFLVLNCGDFLKQMTYFPQVAAAQTALNMNDVGVRFL